MLMQIYLLIRLFIHNKKKELKNETGYRCVKYAKVKDTHIIKMNVVYLKKICTSCRLLLSFQVSFFFLLI